MTVLEIALQVAKTLGKEDLLEFMTKGTSVDIARAKSDRQKIVDCLNSVIYELAGSLCKLRREETFIPSDKKVYFKDFSNRILSLVSVQDQSGNKVKYQLFPTYVALYDDKMVNIVYNYLPKQLTLKDEVEVGSTLIDNVILAYGVISEYYLTSSLYEEAIFWRKKYEQRLSRVMQTKNYKIKGRAFN